VGRGVRQFLDIETGLSVADAVYEVAQRRAPASRVVYVDNDPIVLAHARALLTGTSEGPVAYLHADLRDPGAILKDAARTLDFSRPVALTALMVLHMIPDADDPHGIVDLLLDALAPGSYLALSHPPNDILPDHVAQVQQRMNERLGPGQSMTARSRDDVARFFRSLELLPPGVVQVHHWRPDKPPARTSRHRSGAPWDAKTDHPKTP
jgi:trans-aconitate methyltransferase